MTRNRQAILAAAIAGLPLAIVVIVQHATGPGANRAPAPVATRTLLVSADRMPQPSRVNAPLHSLRVSGLLPQRGTTGTVLSDERCAPDARGVSHCLNEIRLASGRVLRIRHPHRMTEVACLSPGEHITVRAA